MTLIRIAALSLLLGSSVVAFVWFAWGVAAGLLAQRTSSSQPASRRGADARPDEVH